MERTKLTVSPIFQEPLKEELLKLSPFEEKEEQNCRYRLDFRSKEGWVRVKQFNNGTLYLEATDKENYERILSLVRNITGGGEQGASILPTSHYERRGGTPWPPDNKESSIPLNGAERGRIDLEVPYIGTDESGKGDYFGPLVIAGVYTTPQIAKELQSIGVRDSKQLQDGRIRTISSEVKTILPSSSWGIIEISPKRYNELYESFKARGKNLNHLLAWGHAKVLEVLLEKNPDCTHAIADQFGSEHYITSQLQTLGKKIRLYQTPKAEANIGVAAASILARARFVEKLGSLGAKLGIDLPPGAGSLVVERAQAIVNRHGTQILSEIAKVHFKTTASLQVLPDGQ